MIGTITQTLSNSASKAAQDAAAALAGVVTPGSASSGDAVFTLAAAQTGGSAAATGANPYAALSADLQSALLDMQSQIQTSAAASAQSGGDANTAGSQASADQDQHHGRHLTGGGDALAPAELAASLGSGGTV